MAIEVIEDAPPAVQPDKVSLALAVLTQTNNSFTQLAAKGRELRERYHGVAFDFSTGKGEAEARKARQEIREDVRYPMDKLLTTGKSMLNDIKSDFADRASALIEEVKGGIEREIDEQITANEERKRLEREEREAAEARRKDGHAAAIRVIAAMAGEAQGLDSAELRAKMEAVRGIIVSPDSYEEFAGQAQQAKDEALRQINGLLVAALADEEERAELERTRQQQAAFAAEQAAREKALADEREAFEREKREHEAARLREQEAAAAKAREEQEALAKQQQELERQRLENERAVRERADAIEARIQAMRGIAIESQQAGHSAAALKELLMELPPAHGITGDLYGERANEAAQYRDAAENTVRAMVAQAVKREEQEAAQEREEQEALRREFERVQRIEQAQNDSVDALAALGGGLEHLSPEALGERLLFVQKLAIDGDTYGPRIQEARDLKRRILDDISNAAAAAEVRALKERSEAERQREQAVLDEGMRIRHLRMQAKAPEMFALLKEAADGNTYPLAPDLGARADAIIKFVEGDAV